MNESVYGLEPWAGLQGGEVRGDDDRGASQPGGNEGEIVVDRLLDQLSLGWEEGGVVEAQADRDDVWLAA